VDRILPESDRIDAMTLAINERSDNLPIMPMPGGGMAMAPAPLSLALLTRTLWKPGRVLRVRFLDGEPVVKNKVEQYAHQWEQYANIQFAFGDDPDAEIRISFSHDPGSWSYLGVDALTIPKNQPTMNYGWLRANTPNEEYSRVVIHEFGHALGCIHEHQNPVANIPWNKPAVYRYYAGPPNNWSQAQVDLNLFNRYSQDQTQFSAFDRQSIMLYPIPKEFTDGVYEVGWNTILSDADKTFIAAVYPKQVKSGVTLSLDAAPVAADIGKHGEEDSFYFTAPAAGAYTIETGGPTDVTLGLFGPDDFQKQVAHDDDSGKGLNARISLVLQPGEYMARVRHYRPRGTGQYTIWVKRGG
jgi:hypothetical protein